MINEIIIPIGYIIGFIGALSAFIKIYYIGSTLDDRKYN